MSTKRPVTPVSIDEEGNIEKPVRKAEENTSGRPRVQSVYEGFYFRLDPDDDDGFNLLAGANCLIGTELFLEFLQGADGGPSVQIDARHEQRIATLDAKVSKRLADLRNRGWDIQVRLSVVFYEQETKRYIHQYNMPSYSVGETRPNHGPGRREIGHGALAERALLPVIPSEEEFPYTMRLVSEVLSSNGSTSQASICGSTLALMDAGVPIKAPVAGIYDYFAVEIERERI